MNTEYEPSRPFSRSAPLAAPGATSAAMHSALAFTAGVLVSVASLVALGTVGLFRVWLALSAGVIVGCLIALVARRTRLRPLALALGWVATPGLLWVVFAWMHGTGFDRFDSSPFERTAWIAAEGADHTDRTRLRMVKDLGTSGRLDRLTRAEAVALLGRPDGERWGGDERVWVWRIGPAWIDDQWLALRFGPDGRVESHRIVED